MMDSSYIEVQTKTILIKDLEGLLDLSESGSLS